MNNPHDFRNWRFDRLPRRLSPGLMSSITAILILVLLRMLLPAGVFLSILMLAVPLLVWVARTGWQEALQKIISFLQRLQN